MSSKLEGNCFQVRYSKFTAFPLKVSPFRPWQTSPASPRFLVTCCRVAWGSLEDELRSRPNVILLLLLRGV